VLWRSLRLVCGALFSPDYVNLQLPCAVAAVTDAAPQNRKFFGALYDLGIVSISEVGPAMSVSPVTLYVEAESGH